MMEGEALIEEGDRRLKGNDRNVEVKNFEEDEIGNVVKQIGRGTGYRKRVMFKEELNGKDDALKKRGRKKVRRQQKNMIVNNFESEKKSISNTFSFSIFVITLFNTFLNT